MSCVSGTNIVKDGLVFHFDLENGVKSWKGKPTSNLAPNALLTSSSHNDFVPVYNESYEGGVALKNTSGNKSQYVLTNSIPIIAGETYTLSTKSFFSNDYDTGLRSAFCYELANGKHWNLFSSTKGKWNVDSLTFTVETTGYMRIALYLSGPFTTGYMMVDWIQVEKNPYRTKFVNGIRLDTASIIDISPSKHTITANNLTYTQDDTPTFDGTDDYITFDYGRDLTPYQNPLSVSLWVKFFSLPNTHSIFFSSGQGRGNGDSNQRFYLDAHYGQWDFGIRSTGAGQTGKFLNTNTWYNIQVILENGNAYFYLDKNLILTKVFNSSYILNDNFMIGTHDTNYFFNGEIDQVKIYNKALTEDEVKQNFEATRSRYGI